MGSESILFIHITGLISIQVFKLEYTNMRSDYSKTIQYLYKKSFKLKAGLKTRRNKYTLQNVLTSE